MGYKVKITVSAKQSLGEPLAYITNVLHEHRAASQLLDEFHAKAESLASFPTFYPVSACASELLNRTVYVRNVKSYRIFYVVDRKEKTVTVFSFLHQRQDLGSHLVTDFYERLA